MAIKVAPLNSTFMVVAMLGFLISLLWVYPNYPDWGVAFALVFALMFIASMIAMTYAPAKMQVDMDNSRKVKIIKRKKK